MSTTVNDLIKLLDTEENRYGVEEYYEQEIRAKAISNFAEWCYLKGVDFSYMSTSNKSGRQFIDDVIARYCKEQMKEVEE